MRAVSVFPLVACALLLPQPARAQAPPSALVQIDAIVTDARGARVADLQAEDFEVIEEGTARPVERALLISGGGGGAPEQAPLPIRNRSDEREAAGRAGARLFAIFIDEYHITDGPSVGRTREALARFVDSLGPRDLVLLARPLDSLVGLRLTRDREALKDIIGLVEGRNGDYRPRNEFERSIVAGTPDRIEAARSQIVTSALAAMAAHLESLGEGRKALVVISEGFARQPARRDGGLPTIDAVVRAANRAATSIYPIDPRAFSPSSGPAVASDDAASAMLRALASDTSGWPAINPGDAAAGLPHVLGETGGYYLLAFSPGNRDGRFHQVELRVKRPGVAVRARKGYWSGPPRDPSSGVLASRTPRVVPGPATHASPLIRPWFGISRGSDGKMQISFVWEPAARVPGDRTPIAPPTTVVMKATAVDGTAVYHGAEEPSSSEATFQTAPGRLRVELAIRDATSRLLDTDVRDVIVGALAGPVELGTAEIRRSRTARELRALEVEPSSPPTASREFSRAERLMIRVPAYARGGGLRVTASLRNRAGQAMRDLSVTAAPVPGEYQIDLPLAGLASSDYSVAIAAASPEGKADAVVTFRVTP